jgi:hypothetical protein
VSLAHLCLNLPLMMFQFPLISKTLILALDSSINGFALPGAAPAKSRRPGIYFAAPMPTERDSGVGAIANDLRPWKRSWDRRAVCSLHGNPRSFVQPATISR